MKDYFSCGDIPVTDDWNEKIGIGKELEQLKSEIYDARRRKMLGEMILQEMPDSSDEERRAYFYVSLYDYWMYGVNLKEFFCLHFDKKTHEEKKQYISMRSRNVYYQHLNDVKWGYDNLVNKYACYQLFKDDYKREAVLIETEADYDNFASFVSRHPTYVIKPTSLAFGRGIHAASINDYINAHAAFDSILQEAKAVKEKYLLKKANNQYIIEELIVQGEDLKRLHPSSINCVRLNTLVVNGKVLFPYPTLKIGRGGNFISNAGDNGLVVGIDNNGLIETNAFDEYAHEYDAHPDTGIFFRNYHLPDWESLLQLGEKLALQLSPKISFVGWDMAYSEGGWSILEANPDGELILPQMAWQKGIKEDFEFMINWKPKMKYWWQEKILYGENL